MSAIEGPGARQTSLKGKHIIDEIVGHMLDGIEPLHKVALAPSRYEVRLHPSDHDHLRGIVATIVGETRERLDEEIARLNRRSIVARLQFWRRKLTYKSAEGIWLITILEDPDDELEPGGLMVLSELAAVGKGDLDTRSKTLRVTKRDPGGATSRTKIEVEAPSQEAPTLATFTYSDNRGTQRYAMRKEQIVIGRAAVDAWVDLKLDTKPDVSRQHVRVRFDSAAKRFYLKDTSSFGTTIDGVRVPPSIERAEGKEVDRDVWVPLPSPARICLAEVIDLDFENNRKPSSHE